ncbi:MAG: ATP-binding protein, partial [Deltaproteobacteria bacterium]|nr:ATP-binding protein [Deltaproteobacteria bacterium]
DLARLSDPMLALAGLRGVIILDEIQRRPELFPILRVLVDRPRRPARFIVLGSASPDLLRQSSETLAGRIAYHELSGFSLREVGARVLARLWLRGGLPPSYLARSDAKSFAWRQQYIRTFLERDLPQLGIGLPAATLGRFWSMLAHYHGQTWNASEFGRAFGVADHTVRRYLDTLTQTFMVRQLLAWVENVGKRQVRAPKIYLTDSGLLHALLDIRDRDGLERHPKVGASWEGFAMGQVIGRLGVDARECFSWGTHQGAGLDLLVVRGGKRLGFEFKRTTAPFVTRSMHIAMQDLGLTHLDVIYLGDTTFSLARNIRAVAGKRIGLDLQPLK